MATKPKGDLSAKKVRALFDLNRETGVLYWRFNPDRAKQWNTKHAGKAAGYSSQAGYIQIRIEGVLYFGHRLVWFYVHGRWPTEHLDHANGDGGDNRPDNLREATRSENLRNRPIQKNNKSGFKGVRYRPHHGKWEARIVVDGKVVWRAYRASAQEAAAARREAIPLYHGQFARIS